MNFAFAFAKCQSLFLPYDYLMRYLFSVEFPDQVNNIYSHHKLNEGITVILKLQAAQVKEDMLTFYSQDSDFII